MLANDQISFRRGGSQHTVGPPTPPSGQTEHRKSKTRSSLGIITACTAAAEVNADKSDSFPSNPVGVSLRTGMSTGVPGGVESLAEAKELVRMERSQSRVGLWLLVRLGIYWTQSEDIP